MIIRELKEMKEQTGLCWPDVCRACGLKYSNVMRWLGRDDSGVPLVSSPGPKKVKPFSLFGLKEKVRHLCHGKKRTAGTGGLYDTYADAISRRDFDELVSMARRDANGVKAMDQRRIDWKEPGIVWSMDDTELAAVWDGSKIYGHVVMDLGSRYKFVPECGPFPTGENVAADLEKLFREYGAPLFMKMDNHKNFINREVYGVLEKNFVIPLRSPPYYSPYNGSIEKANGEFKEMLADKVEALTSGIREHLQAYAESAVHDLNHKERGCLSGMNSCMKFFGGKEKHKFHKRERRRIYNWIKNHTSAIMEYMEDKSDRAFQSAWRIACETWLRLEGFVSVSVNGNVLPDFCAGNSHN